MTKKIKISELSEFDASEYLNSEEDVAAYLTAVLEENDPGLLAAALGDIARKEQEDFERLKAELALAFAAPESSYQPLTAVDVIARNQG